MDTVQKKISRVEWIDTARGINILLMIMSHCMVQSLFLDFIASFLLPLFFVLTGYTMKLPSTLNDVWGGAFKDVKRLLIPAIGVQLVNGILDIAINGANIQQCFITRINELWWAFPHQTGWLPIWFLILLFWSKLMYYIVSYFFEERSYVIIFLLPFIGIFINEIKGGLPQAIDVALVMIIFLYLGRLLKEKENIIEKNQYVITIASYIYWGTALYNGLHVAVIERSYPQFMLSLVEGAAASFCIIMVSKTIVKKSFITYAIENIGGHTLLILCVHQLDIYLIHFWLHDVRVETIIIRLIIDLCITYFIIISRKMVQKIYQYAKKY